MVDLRFPQLIAPGTVYTTVRQPALLRDESRKMEVPSWTLVNPSQSEDALATLRALYVSLTGTEPTHEEVAEAGKLLNVDLSRSGGQRTMPELSFPSKPSVP